MGRPKGSINKLNLKEPIKKPSDVGNVFAIYKNGVFVKLFETKEAAEEQAAILGLEVKQHE